MKGFAESDGFSCNLNYLQ